MISIWVKTFNVSLFKKNILLNGLIGHLQFIATNYPLHKAGGRESEGSQHIQIVSYERMEALITLITLLYIAYMYKIIMFYVAKYGQLC